MDKAYKISELCGLVGGELNGDDVEINGIADLEHATAGHITFIENPGKEEIAALIAKTTASCLIVPLDAEIQTSIPFIRVKNPKLAFSKIGKKILPYSTKTGWHESFKMPESSEVRATYIGPFVSVGENTYIGECCEIHAGAQIGSNVTIRKCTVIHANCVIYDNVEIGYDCVIHAGTVIGADGFGYVRDEDGYVQFPQVGTVYIDDEVEIGANSCVDRGALGETRIGKGTKIDNLVQIAHNVQIGERVVIAAQTGISGSTVIESDAIIGGQVGMGDHARVLSGAIIGSQAGVLPGKIVRAGVWWGTPVQPLEEYKRQNAHVKGLARLKEEVKELKKTIADLSVKKEGE